MFKTRPANILACVAAVLLLVSLSRVALAQHEASGGSIKDMVGGSVGGSTGRTTTKPATKPTAKPATTTTTVRKRPTPPVKKPVTAKGPSADYYVRQGDDFFTAKNYDRAMDA